MRILVLLAAAVAPLFAEEAEGPLEKGTEVVFLERQGSLPFFEDAAVRYKVVEPDEALAKHLLGYEPFVHAVREYRSLRERLIGRAQAIHLVFEPSLERTAYCAEQPFLLNDPTKPKGKRGKVVIAPLIHVTGRYLDDMKQGKALSVVCHEIGHAFMTMTHGMLDYPGGSPEFLIDFLTEEGHWYTKETDPVFAFSEGWAEFTEYHYTGEPLPVTLVQVRKDDGTMRDLTLTEFRRREGAQAYLMLALDRDASIEDFYERALDVMSASKPQSMNGLMRAYVNAHPEEREDIEKVLVTASKGVYEIDYDYSRDDYWRDAGPNWDRLWETVKKRLGGGK
ncbi:MAG: hypothetical protein AAB434_12190 [Planctomycetota bacterium]